MVVARARVRLTRLMVELLARGDREVARLFVWDEGARALLTSVCVRWLAER